MQVTNAANALQLAAQLQRFRHREDIGRFIVFDQLGNMPIDAAMIVAVKIFIADDIADTIPRLVIQQQAAEYRLLRLDRMRR